MNRAERELFALFVAELMGNKVLLDELYPELNSPEKSALGEFEIHGEEGIAVGPIWYDESKRDPAIIRENVLEKNDDRRKRK